MNPPLGFKHARRILISEKADIAFLVGNGINLVSGVNHELSWDGLMKKLVHEAAEASLHALATKSRLWKLLERGKHGQTPASLPEIFDILEAVRANGVQGTASKKISLQARIAELLKSMEPGKAHEALVQWASEAGTPVLTTNYDHCLETAAGPECCQHRLGSGKPLSDFYPWDRYYAARKVTDPASAFAIWHVHGDRELKRSIRAGLDQYMGMAQRLRAIKQAIAEESLSQSKTTLAGLPAYHRAPWLRVFMRRKLFIQGLGLRASEVALRWLLIQRFRYWNRYRQGHKGPTGWYVHSPTNTVGRLDQERRVFFENVGLEIIEIKQEVNSYEKLYPMESGKRVTP